ncbi:beta-galactosidase family protein [Pedobacter sp. P351]|uniref:glycoside hydrolase family 35 protein n=1 Tax=Pedobacter superstes TaxID=3133441 RepID=UPI0030949873
MNKITHNLALLALLVFLGKDLNAQTSSHTFTLTDSAFLLDGKPFQMVSGEIHYPRVPRESWRHRMKMAKAMGLNTIGTYVFWNVHEPQKGKYDFSGNNDVKEFVKIAQEEGLWVVLRPSPYVCAEWEFGGYPYWLQNIKGLEVRSTESQYLAAYENYIKEVGKQLAPLQVNHGGNVLMTQIENEYGSYGSDKKYLDLNRKMFIEAGFDGILYTCDPEAAIKDGHLPGLLAAINGVDDPEKVKRLVSQNNNGKGPYFIAEWYPAWFDWWGTTHHTVPAAKYAGRLDSVLKAGISINMYMFHGGTTRGFMNGANFNDKNPYEPQISSYDYDAPLDEAGNATEKFMLFREVIQKNLPEGQDLPSVPSAKTSINTKPVVFTSSSTVFDLLKSPITSKKPLTFEDLNQAYGYVMYRTIINGSGTKQLLKIRDLRDYGIVFINGKRAGNLDRRLYQDSLMLTLPKGKVTLDILVENMGRINFGPYLLKNKKGITEKVELGGREIQNWQMYKLPFDTIPAGSVKKISVDSKTPALKKGYLTIDKVADTYLDFSNWGKGVVWINGHNLGKYWEIGPQQTIYVPAEWLKEGKNEVLVFELNKPEQSILAGRDKAILDKLK